MFSVMYLQYKFHTSCTNVSGRTTEPVNYATIVIFLAWKWKINVSNYVFLFEKGTKVILNKIKWFNFGFNSYFYVLYIPYHTLYVFAHFLKMDILAKSMLLPELFSQNWLFQIEWNLVCKFIDTKAKKLQREIWKQCFKFFLGHVKGQNYAIFSGNWPFWAPSGSWTLIFLWKIRYSKIPSVIF